MKLSKREIILLIILAFMLLFIVGVQRILIPIYEQYQDDKQQIALMQASYTSLKRQVDQSEVIMTRLSEAQLEAAQLASQYEAVMVNYDADHYLYDLMEKHRLKAWTLEIQDPADRPEMTYVPGGTMLAEGVDPAEVPYTPIQATTMKVELEGSWQQIFDFMTEVETYPSRIRIASFEVEDVSDAKNGTSVKGTAEFIIYYAPSI